MNTCTERSIPSVRPAEIVKRYDSLFEVHSTPGRRYTLGRCDPNDTKAHGAMIQEFRVLSIVSRLSEQDGRHHFKTMEFARVRCDHPWCLFRHIESAGGGPTVSSLVNNYSLDFLDFKAIVFQLLAAIVIMHNKCGIVHGGLKEPGAIDIESHFFPSVHRYVVTTGTGKSKTYTFKSRYHVVVSDFKRAVIKSEMLSWTNDDLSQQVDERAVFYPLISLIAERTAVFDSIRSANAAAAVFRAGDKEWMKSLRCTTNEPPDYLTYISVE